MDIEVVTNADLWELERRLKDKKVEIDLIEGHRACQCRHGCQRVPMVRVGFRPSTARGFIGSL